MDGKLIRLKSLRGKAVILNFWATWCPPCRDEMPLFNLYATKLKDRAYFIAVNDDETPKLVEDFITHFKINFPVLLDPGGKINALFYVQSYPSTFFIDSDGILRAQHIGQIDEATLILGLEAVEVKP